MRKFLKGKKVKAKKRPKGKEEQSVLRVQIFVGTGIVLVISLLLTGIYFGSRVDSLQITDVTVYGGYTIPHTDVRDATQTLLEGSYFRLVPYTFTWTYPKRAVVSKLAEMPRLKQSQVSLEGQTLTIVFDEYQPTALWCSETESSCYFLDSAGFAFAKAPELSGGAFIRYGEIGKEAAVKTQMVDREFLKTSQAFAQQLADELGLYVTHITVLDPLDVEYTVSGGGVIKVSQRVDLDTTFANVRSILLSEEFAHLETGAFAYIDLRFGDKVFVNEVGEVEQKETATSSEEAVGE